MKRDLTNSNFSTIFVSAVGNKLPILYSGKMEELNKELGPGLMLENSGNSAVENNHVDHEPEPAFSDDEEEMPLRFFSLLMQYNTFYGVYIGKSNELNSS